jgi:hypothetical protein
VHASAGDLLHDLLERLSLAEGVEDRRDRAELERVRPEKHQVVEHPIELGEQRADPGRPLGHFHAEHVLDGQRDTELGAERAEPVVPVRQHDDLAVVAHLEELLDAAMHVADDRLAMDDPFAVEREPQPQHAVGGGVLRTDVQHHVGRGEPATQGGSDLARLAHARQSCTRVSVVSHQKSPQPPRAMSSAASDARESATT